MTRPLRPDEKHLLDHLTRTGLTPGQLAARDPRNARTIRNTIARACRALDVRGADAAIQAYRTQEDQ